MPLHDPEALQDRGIPHQERRDGCCALRTPEGLLQTPLGPASGQDQL